MSSSFKLHVLFSFPSAMCGFAVFFSGETSIFCFCHPFPKHLDCISLLCFFLFSFQPHCQQTVSSATESYFLLCVLKERCRKVWQKHGVGSRRQLDLENENGPRKMKNIVKEINQRIYISNDLHQSYGLSSYKMECINILNVWVHEHEQNDKL